MALAPLEVQLGMRLKQCSHSCGDARSAASSKITSSIGMDAGKITVGAKRSGPDKRRSSVSSQTSTASGYRRRRMFAQTVAELERARIERVVLGLGNLANRASALACSMERP